MHGEQRLGRPRRHAMQPGPHRPLGRGRGARARRPRAKNAWWARGSGSVSSAWISSPAAATSSRTAAREKKCRCPIAAASSRFAGRAAERLSSRGTSISTSCATRAASASERPGHGDVLEHVGEDREVVLAVLAPGPRRRRRPRSAARPAARAAPARRRAPRARTRRTPARARAAPPAARRRRSRSRPPCAAAASSRSHSPRTWAAFERAPSARQRPRRSASAASGCV